MDSREYLNYVLDKLQERIRKLDDAILHGQKEIENMHEYYWENYTEMDHRELVLNRLKHKITVYAATDQIALYEDYPQL